MNWLSLRAVRTAVVPAVMLTLVSMAPGCTDPGGGDGDGGNCGGAKCDDTDLTVADILEGRNDPIAKALLELSQQELEVEGELAPMAALPTEDDAAIEEVEELDEPDLVAALALQAEAVEGFPPGVGGFLSLVRKVAEIQCGNPNSVKTYVIADDLIDGEVSVPRVIANTCVGDLRLASSAFFALSFADGDGDVDGQQVEAFAWDKTARSFEFYRTLPLPTSDEGLFVIVNPRDITDSDIGGCQECHRGNDSLTDDLKGHIPLFPIMNELVEPWSHWNAEPGFVSQDFTVSNAADMPKYQSLTVGDNLTVDSTDLIGAADVFEDIVRAGFEQVVKTRRRALKEDADVDTALNLLRPMFCEEQLNYASEKGVTGEIRLGAVVDEGIRRMYSAADVGGAWEWATGTTASVRVVPAAGAEDVIELVPMRGQSAISFEESLVTSLKGYFSAQEILQIRAIDWQTPVFSDTRCRMWERVAEDPQDVEGAATVHDVMRGLYQQIMKLPGAEDIPLVADGRTLVVDRGGEATFESIATDIQAGSVPTIDCLKGTTCDYSACEDKGYCYMNLWAWGERIDDYVKAFQTAEGRASVREARDGRLCFIEESEQFPNAPALPKDFSCG